MDKQRENLRQIEDLSIKLNNALKNIDAPTRTKLENHNLQVNGISMALQRVQIGIDRTLHDTQDKSSEHSKSVITKIT